MLDASSCGRDGRDTGSIFNFGHLGLKEQKELIWIPTVIKSQADTTLRCCSARNEWHARAKQEISWCGGASRRGGRGLVRAGLREAASFRTDRGAYAEPAASCPAVRAVLEERPLDKCYRA